MVSATLQIFEFKKRPFFHFLSFIGTFVKIDDPIILDLAYKMDFILYVMMREKFLSKFPSYKLKILKGLIFHTNDFFPQDIKGSLAVKKVMEVK